MKKSIYVVVLMVLAAIVIIGCGSKNSGDSNTNSSNAPAANETGNKETSKQETVTLSIFNYKVEIVEALDNLKKEYEAAHPGVKLDIETVGGGGDYNGTLKAKFASGQEPDIFNNSGNADAELWEEKLMDLSDQPWVNDLIDETKIAITRNGKLLGMPFGIEGYGYMYNKDLFEQAGITELPRTLSELEEVAKTLQDHGIIPFSSGYQETWILGDHLFNVALAKQPDPVQFIQDWKAGNTTAKGNPIFEQWVDLLDLTLKYSQKNVLTTDYNTQVTEFATGKAAMLQQGNWVQVQLENINPDLNLGFIPMPISDDLSLNDNIFIGVPRFWVINKDSPRAKEAAEFLNWLVTSEAGKKYIVDEFKFIPAFSNIPYEEEDLGQLAVEIQSYISDNKTLGWHFRQVPPGSNKQFGAAMQAYIAGNTSKDEMLDQFDQIVKDLMN